MPGGYLGGFIKPNPFRTMRTRLARYAANLLVVLAASLLLTACGGAMEGKSFGDIIAMITTPEGFREMIAWGGYIVLFVIVFAETGLLIGFFLPGDSLLVTAGLLASTDAFGLNIGVLNALLIPAAIIGDAVGYSIGLRSGKRLLARPDSRLFKREHLEKTQAFYDKHGGKTIVLARFVPLVRTFAPVVAGLARMPYRTFAMFNITGGVLWIASTTLLGYFLGRSIPDIEKYIHYVIGVVILLSLIPIVIEFVKHRMAKRVP
jgi:membrane-associated protein